VRDVAESPVEITRRGKAVALVISIDEFERLRQGRRNLAEAYARFRAGVDADASSEAWAALQGLQDTSPRRAPS
jgi:prevent-host-death family protein